jgi:pyruvate/2-oxoglutarate dehydrogenase complex dihydrolipoamide acyltransferase (E2) component
MMSGYGRERMTKGDDSLGRYEIRKMSVTRRLYVDSFDALKPGHNMMSLCEFDVTDARKGLRAQRRDGKRVSLFAYIIKAIADTLAEDFEFNSTRSGKRIIRFEDVDVNLPIETDTMGEKLPRQITIRRASEKTVEQIRDEIDAAKQRHEMSGIAGQEDDRTLRLIRTMRFIPKLVRNGILRAFTGNPFMVKKMSGTTFVTSVGSFGDVSAHMIPFLRSPRATSFVVGNVVRKPAVVGREVCIREILSMTLVFNHDIVDGAPAARFVSRLKKRIEKPARL